MTCRELTEFLMAYLSDELPDAQRRVFDEHLAECPGCVTYLHTYEETIKLGRAAFRDPDAPPPADVPEQLIRAILAARKQS